MRWLILFFWCGIAFAQGFPSKPLKLVTPFPPGGSADVIARLAAQKLSENLNQPVVVDNRGGAGGLTGTEYAAKQPPDGYTLVLITGAYPVQAAMLKQMPFDPLADVMMVSMLTSYPFVISVRPDSPFKTLSDLIATAKANPGKLNYPSSGIGTVHHLSGELLNSMAGIEMVHVPFRGGASPLTEVLGGRVDLLLEAMTLSIGQIQSGKLRALAVTSRERWKALPNVPTVAETVSGYEVNSFIGLGTSSGTPRDLVDRLNAEVRKVMANPETRQRFVDLGGEPAASSPEEMKDFISHEIGKWRNVIATRHIERQ
ncbi:MAG TPA: tripartite tricarboxylate transporter substrate binding protein [Burkholderiales bacterium]|jgi:tripartite-type tricarboxylate transporter receptor subunit TctC|nr:tripartite tricarboxylate transporter substrate binding protein [Burkholderiales bacterium]